MSALHPLVGPLATGAAPTVPAVLGLPIDLVAIVAFALLVGAVVGSFVPLVPSGVLSLGGVLLYWWHAGEPGVFLLIALVFVCVLLMAVDWLSGAVSAKAGGADLKTVVLATLVGFVGLAIANVPGFLIGTAGTVFVMEYVNNEDLEASARAAGVTIVGMLTSNVLQVLLSAGVLAVMLAVALL